MNLSLDAQSVLMGGDRSIDLGHRLYRASALKLNGDKTCREFRLRHHREIGQESLLKAFYKTSLLSNP